MMQHQTLFVFDIETIYDTEAAKALTGSHEVGEPELRKALEDYHLAITDGNNSFPRQPFHKVVAISFLEADIIREGKTERYELKELRTGGKENASEKELLEGFFQYLAKLKPRFVSYNGRTFDLPVLKYRAMVHGISAPWLYQSGDKWNSYTSRYSLDWHCDLLDALSDFGASARCKLNEICAVFGFPGKLGVDGSMVSTLYDEGRIKEIRDYCETDVLNTYLVYLRYMYHRGDLVQASYNQAVGDILALVKEGQLERPHLGEFFYAWEDACAGKFTL
jgi:3'-5' exonuclease